MSDFPLADQVPDPNSNVGDGPVDQGDRIPTAHGQYAPPTPSPWAQAPNAGETVAPISQPPKLPSNSYSGMSQQSPPYVPPAQNASNAASPRRAFGWAASTGAPVAAGPVAAPAQPGSGYEAPAPVASPYGSAVPAQGTPGTAQAPQGLPSQLPPPYGYPGPAVSPPPQYPQRKGKTVVAIAVAAILVVFVAGVGLIAAGVGKPPRDPRPLLEGDLERIESMGQSSVVRIGGKACSYQVSGSGFFVSHDLVATNAHVVAGMKDPQVMTYSDVRFDATPVAFDPDRDIAILRINSPDRIAMTLASSDPPEGEGVVTIGYPEAGAYAAAPATVVLVAKSASESIYGEPQGQRKHIVLRMDVSRDDERRVKPGSSGGPVVDRDGVVVGIVTLKSAASAENGIAVPHAEIRKNLEKAKSSGLAPVSTGSCMSL